ncbi:MAG: hypothetical protein AAFU64_16025 [Bacteroidota bacterium]
MLICGIDYGSKLSGTTVICLGDNKVRKLEYQSSRKKQDADAFLRQVIQERQPKAVFIDAPLSLPKVYLRLPEEQKGEEGDYFFRQGDRELKAMSPMFLGGLTARAMKLARDLTPLPLFETYPAEQARRLHLGAIGYKKEKEKILPVLDIIQRQYPELSLELPPQNWHEVDAILAWLAAYRWSQGDEIRFGDKKEGQIFI